MELQEIDVFIEKDGRVRIEVRGAKGMSCLDLTKEPGGGARWSDRGARDDSRSL